jgi:hypothetical protein
MKLFNRNRNAAATTAGPNAPVAQDQGILPTHTHTHDSKLHNHSSSQRHAGFGGRPSVGQWFKHTAVDLITMLVMGMIGLGVYFADPAPSRSFPVAFKDGEIVYPQFSYPLRKEIVPIWVSLFNLFKLSETKENLGCCNAGIFRASYSLCHQSDSGSEFLGL